MTDSIAQAAILLKQGGLVAFPTETVYGLGADARQPSAVRKIFAVKGRPPTNPLIVHVADADSARQWTTRWDHRAQILADRFWPGPLTLVLSRHPSLASEVSAGLDSIGLRMPDHPVALQLLRAFNGPIAAPSANRSNRVSPTTASHVRDELGDGVDLILDGGACDVGIESTVLDLSGSVPTILRPGKISLADLQAIIGPVRQIDARVSHTEAASSPGQQLVHYAPQTPSYRILPGGVPSSPAHGTQAFLTLGSGSADLGQTEIVVMPADPMLYARAIYAALRHADRAGHGRIIVEMPPDEPLWRAIRDRLVRATQPL